MQWSKLVDKAELMVNADRALLVNLMYEAEQELCREVNLIEELVVYTGITNTNTFDLPGAGSKINSHAFKSMKTVLVNGKKIKPMFEEDFYYKNDNTVHDGTPVGYAINNESLIFSHNLRTGDSLRVKYVAVPTEYTLNSIPSIPEIYHKDLVYYACHIATLKDDPNASASFLNLWNRAIEKIKNQEGDRDMVNRVREVI